MCFFDSVAKRPVGLLSESCGYLMTAVTDGIMHAGFGLSVKRIGVALGTALVLSAATVVGTILPIVMDFNAARSQLWFLLAGVAVAVAGFGILGKANLMKDADLKGSDLSAAVSEAVAAKVATNPAFGLTESPKKGERLHHEQEQPLAEKSRVRNGREVALVTPLADVQGAADSLQLTTVVVSDVSLPQGTVMSNPVFGDEEVFYTVQEEPDAGTRTVMEPPVHQIEPATPAIALHLADVQVESTAFAPVAMGHGKGDEGVNSIAIEAAAPEPKGEFWANISIALVAGVARALLNVGLVLGYRIEEEAKALGSSEAFSTMPVCPSIRSPHSCYCMQHNTHSA